MKRIPFTKGFTLIEAVIIVAVLGILAILIVYSYSGVRAKERDTQRQSAINTIWTELEKCYNDKCNSTYPSLSQIQDDKWVSENMRFTDANVLIDNAHNKIQGNNVSITDQYQYAPSGKEASRCTGTSGDNPCIKYVLRAYQEQNPSNPYQKKSKN